MVNIIKMANKDRAGWYWTFLFVTVGNEGDIEGMLIGFEFLRAFLMTYS